MKTVKYLPISVMWKRLRLWLRRLFMSKKAKSWEDYQTSRAWTVDNEILKKIYEDWDELSERMRKIRED